ncbi:hypothetical protein ACS127_11880 [Amphibacillus sp. Q70]|uniref:hypothetical protein n=1 Tax=Amphibacillus sp. Q70 TaxID=3453416 RepID=UPI003F8373E9
MLNKFDLRFAGFLQDEGVVSLKECEERYNKSQSTLKRCVYRINKYLPNHQAFLIKQNQVFSQIDRQKYESLCQKLSLEEYSTNIGERIMSILFKGFFDDTINQTQLYKEIDLSQTTKKKDNRILKEKLAEMNLKAENLYRLGIRIKGSEAEYRKYIALKLSNIVELDKDDHITARKANTPIQKKVFITYIETILSIHRKTKKVILELLDKNSLSVDYASKKFLYIYLAISTLRIERGHCIQEETKGMPEVPAYHLFDHPLESKHMDYIMASLNYKGLVQFPFNQSVNSVVEALVLTVKNEIQQELYTEKALFESLYSYIYKCKILNLLGYSFYDTKLERTYTELKHIYQMVKKTIQEVETIVNIRFSRYQLSVICLIIGRFLMKNRLAGRNIKKVFVITNSSSEKVHYFEESLKRYVEFEIVGYATINELHKLERFDYDEVIVFSSRIQALLLQNGFSSVRLNYYLELEDVKRLIDVGFTSNHNRKLIASELAEKAAGKTSAEIVQLLKEDYDDYFL